MKRDDDMAARLDPLLGKWHQWAHDHRHVRGFNSRSLVAGDYRTSRQYDDENGALDDSLHHRTMEKIDFQVSEMADPHRSAIFAIARDRVVGNEAFQHPRLPADRAARLVIVAEARAMLVRRLMSAGVQL